MRRMVSAASVSAGSPLSANLPNKQPRAAETEAGSLGRVTDASKWSAMARSSLSHGTGVRHGADGSSTVPDWCFVARLPLPRPSRVAIHQDMHISVAQSGELCDGRPYLGG